MGWFKTMSAGQETRATMAAAKPGIPSPADAWDWPWHLRSLRLMLPEHSENSKPLAFVRASAGRPGLGRITMATLNITGLRHGLTARRHCAPLVLGCSQWRVGVQHDPVSGVELYLCSESSLLTVSIRHCRQQSHQESPDSQMPFTKGSARGRVNHCPFLQGPASSSPRSPAEAAWAPFRVPVCRLRDGMGAVRVP